MSDPTFAAEAEQLGIALSPETIEQLFEFLDTLYAANEHINLTRVPRDEAPRRHLLDSLIVSTLIPERSRVLDIGAGAGFPSVPLAIARPDLEVTALDSHAKSLDFIRSLGLSNVETLWSRAESVASREAYDVVTGRAVAPLAIQLELSAGPCCLGGMVLPLRTGVERESIDRLDVSPLGLTLEAVRDYILPGADTPRLIPVYRKTSRTPKLFPRPWAQIKREPIG